MQDLKLGQPGHDRLFGEYALAGAPGMEFDPSGGTDPFANK